MSLTPGWEYLSSVKMGHELEHVFTPYNPATPKVLAFDVVANDAHYYLVNGSEVKLFDRTQEGWRDLCTCLSDSYTP